MEFNSTLFRGGNNVPHTLFQGRNNVPPLFSRPSVNGQEFQSEIADNTDNFAAKFWREHDAAIGEPPDEIADDIAADFVKPKPVPIRQPAGPDRITIREAP